MLVPVLVNIRVPVIAAIEGHARSPRIRPDAVVQGVASALLAALFCGRAVQLLGAGRAALFPALVPIATLALGLSVAGVASSPAEVAGGPPATPGPAVAVGALHLPLRRAQS